MGTSEKPKLTIEELIQRMKDQGVKFTIESEDDARHYISEHTYYFKLMAYRENYRKHQAGSDEGKYLFLEYAYLKELAIIDMHLRYLIIQMALDIEHSLKVSLLKEIGEDPLEDGYEIVSQFIIMEQSKSPEGRSKALSEIDAHRKSEYCRELIEKYSPDYPAWVFVEIIPFGELKFFYEFYESKHGIKNDRQYLLNSVRDIRNAAAHSNCIINKLSPGNNSPHGRIRQRIAAATGAKEKALSNKLDNKSIYDFCALLIAYNEYVLNERSKEKTFEELHELFDIRMKRHAEWFQNNQMLASSYEFVKKLIDALSPMV